MNKYEVIVTKKFETSLFQIFEYIKNILCAEVASNKLLIKFEKLVETLEDSPFIYSKVRRYEVLAKEYRRAIIKKYVVIYDINEEEKKVYLDNIFYGGSDYINKI